MSKAPVGSGSTLPNIRPPSGTAPVTGNGGVGVQKLPPTATSVVGVVSTPGPGVWFAPPMRMTTSCTPFTLGSNTELPSWRIAFQLLL